MRRFTWVAAALMLAACSHGPDPVPKPTVAPDQIFAADFTTLNGGDPPAGGPLEQAKKILDPAQAQIIGPTYTARFDWTATVTSIGREDFTDLGLARPMVAPAGHEIFVAHLPEQQPETLNIPTIFKRGTGAVLVDGKARPLGGDPPYGKQTLMVVTPVGASIQFAVTDQGRTQTLDLRTGRRGPDAIGLFYQPYGQHDVELKSGRPFSSSGDLSADGDLRLVPWTPKNGWAPDGRVWFIFVTSLIQITGYDRDSTMDSRRSFSVVSGGKTYFAQAAALPLFTAGTTGWGTIIAFAVPPTLRTGTLRMTPHTKCHGCRVGPGDSLTFALTAQTV
jgi:hypothetical protein